MFFIKSYLYFLDKENKKKQEKSMKKIKTKETTSSSALSIPAPVMSKVRKLRALYELKYDDRCTITRAVELAVEAQLRMFGAGYGQEK